VDSPTADGRAGQRILSWRRLLLCLVTGILAAAVVGLLLSPELSVLAGWIATASAILLWVWLLIWHLDAEGTRRLAEEEGQSHVTDTVVLIAAVASLAAVVVGRSAPAVRTPSGWPFSASS
jgi:uncharacterized membrane protein